jgi:hypothetical protein
VPASVWMSVKIFRFLRIRPMYPTLKRIQSSRYWFRSVCVGVYQGAIDLIFCSFGFCVRIFTSITLFNIGCVAQWVAWRGSSQYLGEFRVGWVRLDFSFLKAMLRSLIWIHLILSHKAGPVILNLSADWDCLGRFTNTAGESLVSGLLWQTVLKSFHFLYLYEH